MPDLHSVQKIDQDQNENGHDYQSHDPHHKVYAVALTRPVSTTGPVPPPPPRAFPSRIIVPVVSAGTVGPGVSTVDSFLSFLFFPRCLPPLLFLGLPFSLAGP